MKRTLALLMSLVIMFSCLEFGQITAQAMDYDDSYSTFFGVYYQSRVTELPELRALRKASFDSANHTQIGNIKYAYKNGYYYRAEPIEWNIVGEEDGCYILMSADVLESRSVVSGINQWYSSGNLRKWLNSDFMDIAFSDELRADMSTGFINMESDYPYNSPGVSPYNVHLNGDLYEIYMDDYVSIPSKYDIEGDFEISDPRACTSEYLDSSRPVSQYWLRGPSLWHYGNEWTYYVNTSGGIDSWAGTWDKGIRPVIKVKKNSSHLIIGKSENLYNLNLNEFTFNAYNKDAFAGLSEYINVIPGDADYNWFVNGYNVSCCNKTFEPEGLLRETKVPYGYIGNSAVKILAPDYRDFLIPQKVVENWKGLKDNFTAYMQRDKKDGKPYISTVFGKDYANSDDPFHELQTDKLSHVDQGADSDIIITAVGAKKGAKYYLIQSGRQKIESDTGEFVVDLTDSFDDKNDIFAFFKNPDGTCCEPVKIGVDMKKYTPLARKIRDMASFDILGKSGQTIKIDDDVPLAGGLEISLGGLKAPVGISYDNECLKMSIGFNIFSRTTSMNKSDKATKWNVEKNGKWELFKNEVKTIKDTYDDSMEAKKKFDDLKNQYSPGKVKSVSQLEKENKLTFDILGFIEFQFVDVKIGDEIFTDVYLKEGEAVMALGGKVTYSKQMISIDGVPYYGYFEFGAEAKLGVHFKALVPDREVPIEAGWFLNIEPEAKVGAGVGVKGFISGGVYGQLNVPITFDAIERRTKLSLKGEIGLEAELVIITGSKKLIDGEVVIYDEYWDKKDKKLSTTGANNSLDSEAGESGELIPRDYSDNTSEWLSGTTEDHTLLSDDNVNMTAGIRPLQKSVYGQSKAKLVEFGGKQMSIWLEDDAKRDTYNRVRLVYSLYDSASKSWSVPKPIDDTGRLDAYPEAFVCGNDLYLTWQSCNTSFSEDNLTYDDILKSFEIKAAKYDAASDCFDVYTITDNSTYDGVQTMAFDNGTPYVYWVHNDSQTVSGSSYSIKKIALGSTSIETVLSDLNYISGLEICGSDVAYLMDADGDLGDLSDHSLYVNTTMIPLNEENSTASYLTAAELNNKQLILAADADSMYVVEDGKATRIANNSMLVDNNMNIVDHNGQTKFIWTEVVDGKTAVMCSDYSDGGFSEPVVLAKVGEMISNFSVDYSEGKYNAVFNSFEMDSETGRKSTSDFNYFSAEDYTDVQARLTTVCDDLDFIKGETSELEVAITNNGTEIVKRVAINLSDGISDGKSLVKAVDISPGDTAYITVPYDVPEKIVPTEIKLEVMAEGDKYPDNNTDTFCIGKPDLFVSQSGFKEVGDYYVVSAKVLNSGLTPADSVDIKLYNGEKKISMKHFGDLEPGGAFLADFLVEKTKLKYSKGLAELKIEASCVSDEQSCLNNSDTIIISEKQTDDETIYFFDNAKLENVYIFCWTNNVGDNAAWPGEKMTFLREENGIGVWSYTPSKHYDNIIFSNGSSNRQTVDIKLSDYPGKIFCISNPESNGKYTVVGSDSYELIQSPDISELINTPVTEIDSDIIGDVNNDGKLNIRDATGIQLHLAGINKLTGKRLKLADFDGSGSVNIIDVTALQKAVAA